jgi:hypothetical protein
MSLVPWLDERLKHIGGGAVATLADNAWALKVWRDEAEHQQHHPRLPSATVGHISTPSPGNQCTLRLSETGPSAPRPPRDLRLSGRKAGIVPL